VKRIVGRIRKARLSDVKALTALEEASFRTDRITERQFRYLIGRRTACVLVAERGGELVGAGVTLFRKGADQARLYSIAVSAAARGEGRGRALLRAAEAEACRRGCVYMQSEIRADNAASQALFRSAGYRHFGVTRGFYEDGADALRFDKRLVRRAAGAGPRIPYVRQTLDFTCGSAALMMAMKAFRPDFPAHRPTELRLWREATTIFMTSGHGGCGPYGLALAAWKRGFSAAVQVGAKDGLFVDTVRSPEKKEVIRLVEEDFRKEIASTGIQVRRGPLSVAAVENALRRGFVPIVLVSSTRIYGEKSPHWVVVTAADPSYVYIHDPYVDEARGRTEEDCRDRPIARSEFERMAGVGRNGRQAAVFIGRKKGVRC
jgi:ribosomal protein S18 acetylase RimI-like enzyme